MNYNRRIKPTIKGHSRRFLLRFPRQVSRSGVGPLLSVSGCSDPGPGSLNDKAGFYRPGGWKSRPRCGQGALRQGPSARFVDAVSSRVLTWSPLCTACAQISSSLKDTSPVGLGATPMTSCTFIISSPTLSPNTVTFRGSGCEEFAYTLGRMAQNTDTLRDIKAPSLSPKDRGSLSSP